MLPIGWAVRSVHALPALFGLTQSIVMPVAAAHVKLWRSVGVPALCSLPLSRSRPWAGLPSRCAIMADDGGRCQVVEVCMVRDRVRALIEPSASLSASGWISVARPALGWVTPDVPRSHARMHARTHASFHLPAHTHPRTRALTHDNHLPVCTPHTLFKAAPGHAWGCVSGVGNSRRS